jgi:hypothetical protein
MISLTLLLNSVSDSFSKSIPSINEIPFKYNKKQIYQNIPHDDIKKEHFFTFFAFYIEVCPALPQTLHTKVSMSMAHIVHFTGKLASKTDSFLYINAYMTGGCP